MLKSSFNHEILQHLMKLVIKKHPLKLFKDMFQDICVMKITKEKAKNLLCECQLGKQTIKFIIYVYTYFLLGCI